VYEKQGLYLVDGVGEKTYFSMLSFL